ncbi:MAG: 16S rRNA (adenine(1518)-N(6)/adenine(1519)-N(6))-dimethyltransferase RsmA [Mogibacterium sp.]|nr:16S rRNA (adenine(1518)-N(6)/adenine(1519)-N(6))-dimethyltransferase RsmA [Mogibacterium sp.]
MGKAAKKSKVNKGSRSKAGSSHVRPAKALGQNFLIDEGVIDAIVEGSDITEETLVIEIGPGEGALTDRLAESAGRVVAVELDERLVKLLRVKFFSAENVEIIHGDILEVNLPEIIESNLKEYGLSEVRIVGNLPYYITTPIIMTLLEANTGAKSITAMMQKEVGDRLLAEPGSKLSGAITYAVHYRADVCKVVEAGSECFYPAPKVDSVVLRMDLLDEPAVKVDDEDFYFKTIKAGFIQRRKTLLNSLTTLEGFEKASIEKALNAAGIETNRRAESLTMQEFADLAGALKKELANERL